MLSTQYKHCKLPIPHIVVLMCTKETICTPTLLLLKMLLSSRGPLSSCSGAMEIEQARQSKQGLISVGLLQGLPTRTSSDVNAELGNNLVVETKLCTLLYGQSQRGADVASAVEPVTSGLCYAELFSACQLWRANFWK